MDETVVFTIVANGNVTNLWVYCPNGDTLTYTDVGSRYELAFGMSGHFQALVETWNGYGSKCSEKIDFYVGNQTYARLSTNKSTYAVDERVYFTIEADGIKNVLWIYCQMAIPLHMMTWATPMTSDLVCLGTSRH